jgi:hypothetical protein
MESFSEYTVRKQKFRYLDFNKIDNKDLAYVCGYLAGDGAFLANAGYPKLSLSSVDKHIIEAFKAYLCPDTSIQYVGKHSTERVKAVNDIWSINLSMKVSQAFKPFGIFCYKKDRRVIGIPNHLFIHYFHGVMDADGFIGITVRRDCRLPRVRIFITHESEKFLVDLQNKLDELFEIPSTIRQHGTGCYRLQLQHTEKNKLFLDMLYSDTPFVYSRQRENVYRNRLAPDVGLIAGKRKPISSQAVSILAEGSETT